MFAPDEFQGFWTENSAAHDYNEFSLHRKQPGMALTNIIMLFPDNVVLFNASACVFSRDWAKKRANQMAAKAAERFIASTVAVA
jgi:hypothetical protein